MRFEYSEKVVKLFEETEKTAKKEGYKSIGAAHVLMEMTKTPDFQSAYGEADKLNHLRNFLALQMKVYKPKEVDGMKGHDLKLIEDKIITYVVKKANPCFVSEEVLLAHMFLALCTDTAYLHMDDYFEGNEINKVDVFYGLATYCDVDSDHVDKSILETLDLIIRLDVDTKKSSAIPRAAAEAAARREEEEAEEERTPLFSGRASKKVSGQFDKYCVDLCEKSKSYTKPFIGREDVIERTMQVLCKESKGNAVHVGEPGVGKSAVTNGLAKMIQENKVPPILQGSKLYELDLTAMLAGTTYRGDFEARIKMVLDELSKMEKPILFIDEIHRIIGAGAAGSGDAMDAANILKPYLTDGKIKFIGATTYQEYRKYIEGDPALKRRFQKIEVDEPSVENAIKILEGLKESYEKYHSVTYTDEAIRAAVELTAKHIHDRYLPDKAIDMIDEAGAYVDIHPEHGTTITDTDIENVVCDVCKIPRKSMADSLTVVANLDAELNEKVFGQEEAVKQVAEIIKLSKSGLGDESKPIGAFLFVGPSGVGKTELSTQLANTLGIKLLRYDMSEYAESHAVAKLIGSPAGYVGYDDGGVLTNALLQNPHCVLLLDEIEKAHPDIFKTFLQMFDYGMITDNKGRKVDCRNVIIIMTSNAGVEKASRGPIGFNPENAMIDGNAVDDAVKKLFKVEFRNRLTAIIRFNGLTKEMSTLIAKKELASLKMKLIEKGIDASFTDACVDKIAELGTSPEYGARELKRIIDDKLRKMFVGMIINKTAPAVCSVDYVDDEFKVLPVTVPVSVAETASDPEAAKEEIIE